MQTIQPLKSQNFSYLTLSAMSQGWVKLMVGYYNSSNHCFVFYGFCWNVEPWSDLVHTQRYWAFDFCHTVKKAAALDTWHSHIHSIHIPHPQSERNKNHKKVSVGRNIIKVINLYLDRALRVFLLKLRWRRQWTRFSRSLSALCNKFQVDSEIFF